MKFPQKEFNGFLKDHEISNSRFPAGKDYDDEDELSNKDCAIWGFEQAQKQIKERDERLAKEVMALNACDSGVTGRVCKACNIIKELRKK